MDEKVLSCSSISWRRVVISAGMYAVSVIGSGFATGQEIIQFFSAHGVPSIVGTLVTMFVFSVFGMVTMKTGLRFRLASDSETMDFYFGKYGMAVMALIAFYIYTVFIVMISGCGSLANECFGVPLLYGKIICGLIILSIVLLGTMKLSVVVGVMGPVLIFMTISVGIFGICTGNMALGEVSGFLMSTDVLKSPGSWVLAAVQYPCCNIVFLFVVSSGIGNRCSNESEAGISGIMGGVLFGLALLVMNLAFMKNLDIVSNISIPSLAIATGIGKIVAIIFSFVIFTSICMGSVPMMWSICSMIAGKRPVLYFSSAVGLSALAQILAVVEFRTLVNIIYPLTSYFGFVLLTWIMYRAIKRRKR